MAELILAILRQFFTFYLTRTAHCVSHFTSSYSCQEASRNILFYSSSPFIQLASLSTSLLSPHALIVVSKDFCHTSSMREMRIYRHDFAQAHHEISHTIISIHEGRRSIFPAFTKPVSEDLLPIFYNIFPSHTRRRRCHMAQKQLLGADESSGHRACGREDVNFSIFMKRLPRRSSDRRPRGTISVIAIYRAAGRQTITTLFTAHRYDDDDTPAHASAGMAPSAHAYSPHRQQRQEYARRPRMHAAAKEATIASTSGGARRTATCRRATKASSRSASCAQDGPHGPAAELERIAD